MFPAAATGLSAAERPLASLNMTFDEVFGRKSRTPKHTRLR